jgi:hypothetical protein
MNAGMVLSMGGFFTLMAVGLASRLPNALTSGLTNAGVSPAAADAASHVSPVGSLFAAFLGDNPIQQLVPHPGPNADTHAIYGRTFFPHLISGPFTHGLLIAFSASILMLLLAAGASLMRGERYVHEDAPSEHPVADAIGAALSVPATPAVPDNEVAFRDAMSGRT